MSLFLHSYWPSHNDLIKRELMVNPAHLTFLFLKHFLHSLSKTWLNIRWCQSESKSSVDWQLYLAGPQKCNLRWMFFQWRARRGGWRCPPSCLPPVRWCCRPRSQDGVTTTLHTGGLRPNSGCLWNQDCEPTLRHSHSWRHSGSWHLRSPSSADCHTKL